MKQVAELLEGLQLQGTDEGSSCKGTSVTISLTITILFCCYVIGAYCSVNSDFCYTEVHFYKHAATAIE